MSDLKKIKQAKKGNAKAFQELMEEEKTKLYRIAFIYTKNEADAMEVFQETVYKAFISIQNLKEPHYFSTWLTRILINTALDLLRKKKKIIPMEKDVLESKAGSYLPSANTDDVLQMIMQLEEKYKTALILRFYKDLTIKQIAEALSCPEGTVKTNIHRGIQLLRAEMKEDCVNE